MSFTRLRRSSIYPKVIQIYEQVKNENFYSKQVGLSHTDISALKNNGYIINVIGTNGHKQNVTITSPTHTTYKVKLYHLTQRTIDIVVEDIRRNYEKKEQEDKIITESISDNPPVLSDTLVQNQ
ncbi:MAG: hypothetical protein M0R51_11025 [Clostridia bacterium]|jgi:hypothetical protein|nr:hypothetical protein [Clostridia bacterium]